MGYCDKIIEGGRRFRQLASVADTKADLLRAALTAKNASSSANPLWKYTESCLMGDEEGYWIRAVVPRTEDAVGRGGPQQPLERITGRDMDSDANKTWSAKANF